MVALKDLVVTLLSFPAHLLQLLLHHNECVLLFVLLYNRYNDLAMKK